VAPGGPAGWCHRGELSNPPAVGTVVRRGVDGHGHVWDAGALKSAPCRRALAARASRPWTLVGSPRGCEVPPAPHGFVGSTPSSSAGTPLTRPPSACHSNRHRTLRRRCRFGAGYLHLEASRPGVAIDQDASQTFVVRNRKTVSAHNRFADVDEADPPQVAEPTGVLNDTRFGDPEVGGRR
jgi:hypothetical protein